MIKKAKSKRLEKQRTLFFEVGLVTALGLLLVAFNWESPANTPDISTKILAIPIEDEMVVITKPEEIKKPEIPKKKIIENIVITDSKEQELKEFEWEPEISEPIKATKIKIDNEAEIEEEHPFVRVPEIEASFPGGNTELIRFMQNTLKYPAIAKENGMEGMVYLQVTIEASGQTGEIIVLRSTDEVFTEAAIQMLERMPAWNPGKHGGRPVVTRITIPIRFRLN